MGFIMVYEDLEPYSAFSSGISEKLLEAAVENGDLSSSIPLGSTTAEVRDVLVLTSPHGFVGQSLEGAWYSRAPGIRWHQTSSLFSSSWLKRDFLSGTAVRSRGRFWEGKTSGNIYWQQQSKAAC